MMEVSVESKTTFQLHFTPKLYECNCCGESKPESEFYKESYTNQRTKQCKACINIKRSVQRSKAKHGKFVSKEKIRGMEAPKYVLQDWQQAMLHFRGACAFCGKVEGRGRKDKLDRDHLLAISQGGKTVRDNIVPACTKCNRGRGNRMWRDWYPLQAGFTEERARRIEAWERQEGYKATVSS